MIKDWMADILLQYLEANADDFQNFCWKNGDGGADEEIVDALARVLE